MEKILTLFIVCLLVDSCQESKPDISGHWHLTFDVGSEYYHILNIEGDTFAYQSEWWEDGWEKKKNIDWEKMIMTPYAYYPMWNNDQDTFFFKILHGNLVIAAPIDLSRGKFISEDNDHDWMRAKKCEGNCCSIEDDYFRYGRNSIEWPIVDSTTIGYVKHPYIRDPNLVSFIILRKDENGIRMSGRYGSHIANVQNLINEKRENTPDNIIPRLVATVHADKNIEIPYLMNIVKELWEIDFHNIVFAVTNHRNSDYYRPYYIELPQSYYEEKDSTKLKVFLEEIYQS